MSDHRDAVDDLQADMAAHQRRHVGDVTSSANQTLAAAAFERLEREQADARQAPAAEPTPAQIETKTERRDGEHGAYTVKTEADKPMLRQATKAEGEFFAKAMPRIELLLTKVETGPLGQPSWNQRVLAVMSHKSKVAGARLSGLHDYADALDRRFLLELLALLDDSSRLFGDWRADEPTKVTVSG